VQLTSEKSPLADVRTKAEFDKIVKENELLKDFVAKGWLSWNKLFNTPAWNTPSNTNTRRTLGDIKDPNFLDQLAHIASWIQFGNWYRPL
jgi:hypothetical protein